jgi:ribosomal protein S18 acetylase RimI-like enzyme
VIRAATDADRAAVREIDRLTWSTLSSPVPLPPPERQYELDGLYVAELEDGIAGYVQIGPALPIESNRHVLEIKGIAVDPGHQRRGVARALIHAAIGAARTAGARKLTLRVLANNEGARRLYAASGFEVEGVLREFFYLDGRYVDDVLMALPLTGDGATAST